MSSQARKPKLLIVDTAPAMAQVLKTYALKKNLEADVFSDSAVACTALAERFANQQLAGGYDCMVLGWPQGEVRIISDLLITLASADHSDLPLIILSEEADKDVQALAHRRSRTQALLWRNYERIETVLQRLVVKEKPVIAAPVAISQIKSDHSQRSRTGQLQSVLLVDDAPVISHVLRKLLESNGYHVEVAGSGTDARKALNRKKFDLVVTELFLHDESGEELCRYMGSLSEKTRPVYAVMTSKKHASVVQQSLAVGAIACLDKSESSEVLFARLDAIATGLSSRIAGYAKGHGAAEGAAHVQPETCGIAELIQDVAMPALLIGKRRDILAANQSAANLLSDGDIQALQSTDFEKSIHGVSVKRSLEDPVKALFRTLGGKTLSVAYRGRDINASEYGIEDDVCLLTFESVGQKSRKLTADAAVVHADVESIVIPTATELSVDAPVADSELGVGEVPTAVDGPIATAALAKELSAVVPEELPAAVVEAPQLLSVREQIERILKSVAGNSVYRLLMLDIKLSAIVTGDRISLGKSKPMLDIVEAEISNYTESGAALEYIGAGKFLLLFEAASAAQLRSTAEKLVDELPVLVSYLTDVQLVSHASFIELPRRSNLTAGYILKHCEAACMKIEMDGLDNTIYDIDAGNKLTPECRSSDKVKRVDPVERIAASAL